MAAFSHHSGDDNDDGGEESSCNGNSDLVTSTSTQSEIKSKKISRKGTFLEQSLVPKLIDSKRRQIEKQLGAAQRDPSCQSREQKTIPILVKDLIEPKRDLCNKFAPWFCRLLRAWQDL